MTGLFQEAVLVEWGVERNDMLGWQVGGKGGANQGASALAGLAQWGSCSL